MAEAHERGIIHRDLKPGNILIDRGGEPIILDFGLAKSMQIDEAPLTRVGGMLGTPVYMPPEQVNGDVGAMGPHSDIYSLGVVLFQLATGHLPFQGTVESVTQLVLYALPALPSTFQPGLDPRIDAICLTAMAKQPDQRFGNMRELAAALRKYLDDPRP